MNIRYINRKINAIFWDFDGTLVDTRMKNLQVTLMILKSVSDQKIDHIPVLQSIEFYDKALRYTLNWRTFYREELGMSEEQIAQAGQLWTEFQLKDKTPTPIFEGISSVIEKFGDIPQGIISQNSRRAIYNALEGAGISHYFDVIVGYEEVGLNLQKPAPQGMIIGLDKIVLEPDSLILFIGDHETDVLFVKNANKVLQERDKIFKVLCIGALYGYDKELEKWRYRPDYSAYTVRELISIMEKIDNAGR